MVKKANRVLTYGTFDLFHYGHYNILKRASEMADSLIVGVSSDKMCEQKGKIPYLSQEKRIEIVSSLRFVDKVLLEESMDQKIADVKKYGVDLFLLGDDYKEIFPKMPEYDKLISMGCRVCFLPRTPDISTSEIKEKIKLQQELDNDPDSIHNKTKV